MHSIFSSARAGFPLSTPLFWGGGGYMGELQTRMVVTIFTLSPYIPFVLRNFRRECCSKLIFPEIHTFYKFTEINGIYGERGKNRSGMRVSGSPYLFFERQINGDQWGTFDPSPVGVSQPTTLLP